MKFYLKSSMAVALLAIWVALGAVFAAPSSVSAAIVSRDINSYVLFALDELDFKGGNTAGTGFITGGNVGVNRADPNPGDSAANMNIGVNGRFVMSDGTHAVADTMRLGSDADVWDVFVNVEKGAFGGTIRNTKTSPIPDWNGGPLIPLNDILNLFPFDPARTTTDPGSAPDLSWSDTNNDWNLAPDVYGEINAQNGTTLNLSAGLYDMRFLNLGQNVTVNMTDQTILQVDDRVALNGATFGANTSGLAEIYIGAESGDNSQFGEGGDIWGQFFSLGNLRLGRANELYGRFWAGQIGSDFNDNVTYIAPDGGVIPEPASCVIWSMLGALAISVGWYRRRKPSR